MRTNKGYRTAAILFLIAIFSFLGCEKLAKKSPTAVDTATENKPLAKSSLPASLSSTPDIIVNTTSDVADFGGSQQVGDLPGPDGVVSLREAIIAANNTAGSQVIGFNIPTNDAGFDGTVFTINPTSNLPDLIDDGTVINGTTQTAFSGDTNGTGPEITVDFTFQGDGGGFNITSAHNIIHSLTITKAQVMGINITGPDALHNRVTGCFVVGNGTGLHGGEDGINIVNGASHNIIGGTSPNERNIISGNIRAGIIISGDPALWTYIPENNIIIGNFIGTHATGTQAWPNANDPNIGGPGGVAIFYGTNTRIGGSNPGEGNLISGNGWVGVELREGSNSSIVAGNFIGVDVNGTTALGNNIGGVVISGDASSENVSHDNIIGGSNSGSKNVISGNLGFGILIWRGAHHNNIQGNLIGTDHTGMNALGNQRRGVNIVTNAHDNLIGGYESDARNIISANGAVGVIIQDNSYNNHVLGNLIGTDATGAPVLGNAIAGIMIRFSSFNNVIGGYEQNTRNLIAGNDGPGIIVSSDGALESTSNRITGNSIHSNSELGIDLNPTDVNLNDLGDTDTGPNNLMNFPALTSAKATPGQLIVKGTIDTPNPQTVTIEFFANSVPTPGGDPSGHGEGAIFLGTKKPNPQGKFTATLPSVSPGTLITATATDVDGNTSEFAANIQAKAPGN